jgi:hypothetical protein
MRHWCARRPTIYSHLMMPYSATKSLYCMLFHPNRWCSRRRAYLFSAFLIERLRGVLKRENTDPVYPRKMQITLVSLLTFNFFLIGNTKFCDEWKIYFSERFNREKKGDLRLGITWVIHSAVRSETHFSLVLKFTGTQVD